MLRLQHGQEDKIAGAATVQEGMAHPGWRAEADAESSGSAVWGRRTQNPISSAHPTCSVADAGPAVSLAWRGCTGGATSCPAGARTLQRTPLAPGANNWVAASLLQRPARPVVAALLRLTARYCKQAQEGSGRLVAGCQQLMAEGGNRKQRAHHALFRAAAAVPKTCSSRRK